METTIQAKLTLEEAQFILACIKGCPIQTTVENMPRILAMVGSISQKLNVGPAKPVAPDVLHDPQRK